MPANTLSKLLARTLAAGTLFVPPLVLGTDDQPDPAKDKSPGHSFHAEVFNEGPRQAAYLMQGMGNVHWKISTENPMAQRFFDQGIAQLHGFWYFEAARSITGASPEPTSKTPNGPQASSSKPSSGSKNLALWSDD